MGFKLTEQRQSQPSMTTSKVYKAEHKLYKPCIFQQT